MRLRRACQAFLLESSCPSAAHHAKVRIVTDDAVRAYLSKLGKKGAASLNSKLTPAQRKRSAKKAAQARWSKVKKEKA